MVGKWTAEAAGWGRAWRGKRGRDSSHSLQADSPAEGKPGWSWAEPVTSRKEKEAE